MYRVALRLSLYALDPYNKTIYKENLRKSSAEASGLPLARGCASFLLFIRELAIGLSVAMLVPRTVVSERIMSVKTLLTKLSEYRTVGRPDQWPKLQ
jgi:hypothetical protein